MPKYIPEMPDLSTEKPSENTVNTWFVGFLKLLSENKITSSNPMSLSALKVRPDVPSEDQIYDQEDALNNQKRFNKYKFVKSQMVQLEVIKNLPPATGNALAPQFANYPGKSAADYPQWVINNLKDPASPDFPYSEKVKLYELSRKNRLYILPEGGHENTSEHRYIRTDKNGEPYLTAPATKINVAYLKQDDNRLDKEQRQENAKILKESRMTQEEMKQFSDEIFTTYDLSNRARKTMRGQVLDLYTQVNRDSEVHNEIGEYAKERHFVELADFIAADSLKHPNRYATPQDRKKWCTLYSLNNKGEAERTPAETKFYRQYAVLFSANIDKTEKAINKNNLLTLMDQGKLHDSKGHELLAHDYWDKIALIAKHANQGGLIVTQTVNNEEKNICLTLDLQDGSLNKCPSRQQYIDELVRLGTELQNTNPIMGSAGSPAYLDLTRSINDVLKVWNKTAAITFDPKNVDNQEFKKSMVQLSINAYSYMDDKARLTSLNSRQIHRLRIINRILDLEQSFLKNDDLPAENYEDRIAAKLADAYNENKYDSGKPETKEALTDRSIRNQRIQEIKQTDVFKKMVSGRTPQQLKSMLKTDHNKLYRTALNKKQELMRTNTAKAPSQDNASLKIPGKG